MDCRLKKFKKYRSNIKKMNNLVSISGETNLKHLNYLANSVTIDENNKIILTLAGQFWFVNLSQLLQEYIKLTLQFNSSNNLTGEKVSL